jgi:hypothetical protein
VRETNFKKDRRPKKNFYLVSGRNTSYRLATGFGTYEDSVQPRKEGWLLSENYEGG